MRSLIPILLVGFGALVANCATSEPAGSAVILIRGQVMDARTSQPVTPANVTLQDRTTGVVTATGGEFELRAPRPHTSDLTLLIRHIGHAPTTIVIRLGPDSVYDLGAIRIQWAPVQLDNVHVDSERRQ